MSAHVTPSSRATILDVLRGFALLGILIINAQAILAVKGSTPAFTIEISPAERLLQDLILFFIESKFFTLFSLLFGIGFAIQIQSAQRQGLKFLPRISRRMFTLLLFGLAHIIFLWDGDILLIYAITGTLLIFLRKISYKAIRRWVIGLLAVPAMAVFIVFLATIIGRWTEAGSKALSASDKEIAKSFADTTAATNLATLNFVAAIPERITAYLNLSPLLVSRIPTVLAMFLIGLYIGRSNFYLQLHSNKATLVRIRNISLTLGLSSMLLILLATKFLPTTTALVAIIEDQYFAGPVLCLAFASIMTLTYLAHPEALVFRGFSIVGRMALTNYLSQSLILTCIAYGWGFGLATKLNTYQVLGISMVLYMTQIAVSYWWQQRFYFGPLEYLWRCSTYWSIPRNRKSSLAD